MLRFVLACTIAVVVSGPTFAEGLALGPDGYVTMASAPTAKQPMPVQNVKPNYSKMIMSENCPCRTNRGECRYGSDGKPAGNC